MTHEEKIAYLLNDLGQKRVNKYTIAPPLYRLLWRLGIKVLPPHFAGFWSLTLFMGAFFAVGWGILMWLMAWHGERMPAKAAVGVAAIAGFLFGLAMAGYYRWHSRQLTLPPWKDYPVTGGNRQAS
jgi:hypothetical protein